MKNGNKKKKMKKFLINGRLGPLDSPSRLANGNWSLSTSLKLSLRASMTRIHHPGLGTGRSGRPGQPGRPGLLLRHLLQFIFITYAAAYSRCSYINSHFPHHWAAATIYATPRHAPSLLCMCGCWGAGGGAIRRCLGKWENWAAL